MIAGSIARRYAKALLSLGVDQKNYEQLGKELGRLTALVEGSAELSGALGSPVFPLSERRAILRDILRRLLVSKTLEHFVLLVLDHNRIGALVAIAREYGTLADAEAGRVRALVTSARPLRDAEALRIKAALEKRTGKQVIMVRREDPALIGGVTVQIGDVVYDGSVRNQLATIKEQLLAG